MKTSLSVIAILLATTSVSAHAADEDKQHGDHADEPEIVITALQRNREDCSRARPFCREAISLRRVRRASAKRSPSCRASPPPHSVPPRRARSCAGFRPIASVS
jgi:hypothetical protein